jgi:NAD(P)-dependent dehydrogenase (short-subunit alcohol dehydrogenase family)
MELNLNGKVAIVTGAGRGIGRAIVLRLAREGADVVVNDVNLEGANKVVEEIKALGRRALAIRTDVVKSGEVKQMVETPLKEFGQIDILINNAGGSARERQSLFYESTEEVWDYVIGINLKEVRNCCRAVIGLMMSQRRGKIVNIASYAGICGVKGLADYSAAKAGIIGFTRALAKEVASYGININCVSPGPIETPGMLEGYSRDYIENTIKTAGFGRFGKPEEIASMVAFLASDEANFISGQNIPVCGIKNLGY